LDTKVAAGATQPPVCEQGAENLQLRKIRTFRFTDLKCGLISLALPFVKELADNARTGRMQILIPSLAADGQGRFFHAAL
jgi:hypothetical protein